VKVERVLFDKLSPHAALLRTVLRMRSVEAFADSGSSSFAAAASTSSSSVSDAEVLTLVRDHCRALRMDLLALTVEPLLAAFRTDPMLIASYFRCVWHCCSFS
jgi:hypothetical protein